MIRSAVLGLSRARACALATKKICCMTQTSQKHSWVVPSPYTDIHIPDESVTQYLFNIQEKFADKTAVISGDTGESLTHKELRDNSLRVGSALSRLGISKGDVVAVALPNCVEYPYSFLGISYIGATPTTVSFGFTADETKRQIVNSDTVAVICNKDSVQNILKISKDPSSKIRAIISTDSEEDGVIPMKKILQDDGKGSPLHLTVNPEEDIAALPYSSGTTGLPKGVMLTHKGIVANLVQAFHPDVTYFTEASEKFQEKIILALPMFHIYAMTLGLFWSIVCGGCIITLKQFEPKQFIETYKKYHPTVLPTVPPMLNFVCKFPDFKSEILKDSHTHTLLCGGAPVGKQLMQQFHDKFGTRVQPVEVFGMTESGPMTHMAPKGKLIAGSCGVAVSNTFSRIVDVESGENLGPNEGSGELWVKGPQMMKGYFKNPEATAATLVEDAWLRTGDIAVMDEGYHFYIVDRLKDLIKVKGFQVSPAEVEHVLREFPGVLDAGVIGVPDEKTGQSPKAYIVPTPGTKLKKEEISKYIEEKLSSYKHLHGGIEFIDEIPRTKSGKIQRQNLP